MARAVRAEGFGVASLSLTSSAYGFGGSWDPDMACRSLEGAAFTVSLSEFFPAGGGVRDTEAVGVWLEGLPLRRVLVRVYGFVESRAAEVGAARVERRVGGMATAAVSRMRMVVGRCWRMGMLLARLIEGCPNAKLPSSIKLAAVAQTLVRRPFLPSPSAMDSLQPASSSIPPPSRGLILVMYTAPQHST